MTRLSAPTVYQCSFCAKYFTRSVLTFLHFHDDVPEWSDGMNGQWWAGIGAPVGRCPVCDKVIWVDDAKKVMAFPQETKPIGAVARLWHRVTSDRKGRLRDEWDWIALPREIKEAGRIIGLQSIQDFLDAMVVLPKGIIDREIYVRRRLWWAFNDHLRLSGDETSLSSLCEVSLTSARANMLHLLHLIEHDPCRQVERGELLRELGRFDEAVAVLDAVPPDGYNEVRASQIAKLARQRDSVMRPIKGRLR